MGDASGISFELAEFEHLVETQRGHIVRVEGTWSAPDGGSLPHPTLIAGAVEDGEGITPLPIPGQDPPRADGSTLWRASYSIPKGRMEGRLVHCRLQPAPNVLVALPDLAIPEGAAAVADRPPVAFRTPAPEPVAAPAAQPEPSAPAVRRTTGNAYLAAVRSHRRVVTLIIAAAFLGSVVGLAVRSPTYQAAAQILVSPLPRGSDLAEGLAQVQVGSDPNETIQTVATLLHSQDVARLAAGRMGHGWPPQRVLSAVAVSPVGASNVLAVQGSASDREDAARLANTFARAAVDLRDQRLRRSAATALARANAQLAALPDKGGAEAQAIQLRIAELTRIQQAGDPTVAPLRQASVPDSPDGLPAWAILVLTALAGTVIAVAAAALLDLLNPGRIDSEADMSWTYPLPILTRLPVLPRRRATPDAPELREAFRTLQVQLELEPGRHRAIMITSASSGDGKTTTALAFATELAASGREVIVADLDLRKSDVRRRLGITPHVGLEHVLDGRVALADALIRVPGHERLSVLSIVGEADIALLDGVAAQLPDIIEGATALADYIVIDTAPVGEISDALSFTRAVDDLLVVCRLGRTPQGSFQTLRDVLERIGEQPSGAIVIGSGTASAASAGYLAETVGAVP